MGPHPNGFLSRDSQVRVPKFQQLGLPPFWECIISCADLRSQWGLKQSYSPHRKLSNDVSHFTRTHRGWVDSRLLVVGVKLPIWFLAFLFVITCATDVQMAHASPFSTFTFWYLSNVIKNASMQGVWTPAIKLWNFKSLGGLPCPHFGSEGVIFSLFQSRVVTHWKWFR
jgi:hypothetical protein